MLGKFGFVAATLVLAASLLGCDNSTTEEKVQQFIESAAEKVEAGKASAAIIELKNALQLAPKNVEARRRLGKLYLKQGAAESAVKEFRRALEYGAATTAIKPDLARALLLANEPEEVLNLVAPHADEAALTAGVTRSLYGLRAQALLATGDSEAAAALARRILEHGESFEARVALNKVFVGRGEHEAALDQIEKALAERPGNPQALWLKASSQISTGKLEGALETLEKARKQPWRPAVVDIALIEVALKQKNTEFAWRVLGDLGTQFADDPRVKYFRALRALTEKRYDEARQIVEEVTSRYPDFLPAAYVAGAAHVQLGNFELARSYLERFLQANPDNRYGRILLARAWEGLGESGKAREVLGSAQRDGTRAGERQLAAAQTGGDLGLGGAADATDLQTPEGRRAEVQAIVQHIQNEEFEAAMAKARELGEAVPESPLPVQLQGVILWAQGKQEEAIARMKTAVEQAPQNANAAVNLARMHRARGESESALKVLEPALAANPENAVLLVEAARAHAARNESERVRSLLEKAVAAEPGAADARAYLARFHLLQGRPAAAVEVAEAAPEEQQDNPALLEVVGRAHQAQGNYEDALAAFEKLSEAVPDRPEGYLRAGETLLAMNRPGDAVAALEKARERSDSPKEIEVYLARSLLQSGQGERAGKLIAELEEEYPEESDVAILRGNHALVVEQDPQAAVGSFEKALELEPSETRLMDLVRLHSRLGQVDKAVARLQQWRGDHEPSIRVDSALAELHLTAGQLDAARDVYQDLVARAPENPVFQNNLAWVLGEQGTLDAALEHARKAAKLAPEDPGIQDTLGMVLLKRGETAKARAHLEKAAKAAPEREDIQVNYGEVLVAAGAHDEAQTVLKQLASKNLSDSLRERVDQLLEQVR